MAYVFTMLHHLFVLRVPYVPTTRAVAEAMITLADVRPGMTVFDLGAGDARLLISALRRTAGIRVVGVEAAPLVWLLGWIRIRLSRLPIEWRLQSALKTDLRGADVVFLYVTPVLMIKLAPLLKAQLKAGAKVVSHVFQLPGVSPERVVAVKSGSATKSVYVYRF